MNDPVSNDNTPICGGTISYGSAGDDEKVCESFVSAWQAGQRPRIEDLLGTLPSPARSRLLERLLGAEVHQRRLAGETPDPAEYLPRFRESGEIVWRILGVTEASLNSTVSRARSDQESNNRNGPLEATDPLAPTLGMPASATPPVSRSRAASAPLIPGYEIERELGRGGMGVVYLARQTRLKRLVALKVIRGIDGAATEDLERFRGEAEAVAALQHPNIVQIFEVGEHDGGPFCALEFVDGGSLSARLNKKPVPPAEAAALLETLARAVHYAHQKGIVHRDLKPANVLMASDGTPKITDFGLAKRMDVADSGLTRTGAVMGTPAYMAPEQAKGETKDVGPAADIYGLGAILYELLTGRYPFVGATVMETLQQVLTADPVPPSACVPGVPRDLETVCLKCLAKQPGGRYSSALSLAQDVERFLAGEPILARREGFVQKVWRKARKRTAIIGAVAVAVLALTAAVFALRESSVSRRVAMVAREFQEGLETEEWSNGQVDALERLATSLGEFEKSRGEEARHKLLDRVAGRIRNVLRRPRVTAEDLSSLQKDIRWLAARDESLAQTLRMELSGRLRDWQPVVDVAAPFANSEAVFQPQSVRRDTQGLIRREAAIPIVPTAISSRGRVRLTVTFSGSWESSRKVGVVIHHAATSPGASSGGHTTSGYEFVFVASQPAVNDENGTFHPDRGQRMPVDFRDTERHGELRIVRNGIVLQRRSLSVGPGIVSLMAERDGERLRLQLNDLPEITFTDVMPLVGDAHSVFGVIWPNEAAMTHLRVDGSLIPPAASPLERADDRYDQGQFADALAQYEEQVRAGGDVVAEARCKSGMCLNAMNRPIEAGAAFEAVLNSPGDRWPVVAATQLWLMRLREKRYADADALYAAVSVRFTTEQLAQYVPLVVREELVRAERIPSLNLLLSDPEITPRIEAMYSLAKLLGLEDAASGARNNLMVAHAVNRNFAQAASLAEDEGQIILQRLNPQTDVSEGLFWTVRWYCWSQRASGHTDVALSFATRMLESQRLPSNADAIYQTNFHRTFAPLRLELTRSLAVVGDWEAADSAVDKFLTDMPRPISNYTFFSQPFLLKGFLIARKGDANAATAVWKRGTWQSYLDQFSAESRPNLASPPGMWGMIDHWIMAALSETLSDDDAVSLWHGLLARASSDPLMAQISSAIQVSPAIMRGTWRSPRGREHARRLAFLDLAPIEYMRTPPILVLYEKLRQDLFAGQLTSEQDEVTWSVVSRLAQMHFDGKLSKPQVLQLALAWKGTSGILGWAGVSPTLPPDFRGAVAYLMGLRYLKLGKPEEARAMFRTTSAVTPDGSAVNLLARQELERIGT